MPQGLPDSEESHSALQMKKGHPRAGKKAHPQCPHRQAHVATEPPHLAGPFSSLSAAPAGIKTGNLRIAGLKASWALS